MPDISLPDVRFGDRKLRDARIPDIDLRDRLADVDLGHLRMPDVTIPAALRDFAHTDVSIPNALRHVSLPDTGWDPHRPTVDDLRRFGVPEAALARFGVKPKRQPSDILPWALVGGMAGAFAAWWLWTSSMTGPRIRAALHKARRAMSGMGGSGDWEQATDGGVEPYWASPDGWRTAGEDDRSKMPEAEPAMAEAAVERAQDDAN
jgi:hypothetical protein